ncbi:endonuclease-reverse transcriptase [Plakobranchus ocellatus]|uniref:Endonuclease-reverse transcriptase n=1 Tax=Plakobranchus ocellatus TaxID=259542 RepID=A0AAV4D3X2_9GAST|nr:endonuclease-reverse transcriptase [Plakobranchus ocellatus]
MEHQNFITKRKTRKHQAREERMKLNILGLSEVRWKGAGKITSGGHEIIYSGGTESEKGTGIIVDQTVSKAIKGYWALSDRVLLVKIAGKPVDLNIIQVYAPTANSNDEDLDKFYNDLDTAKTQCKFQDPLIIMGDFNAKVGTDKVDDIVGKHGLGFRNERGEKLIEWCQTNNIIVGSTWFQQPPRRKWTWKSPGDETRNQIDYMIISKRYRNALLLAKTYPSADCYSDHVPVVGKFKLKLKKNSKPFTNIKFDLAILKTNQTIREKYQISVQNKFEALGDAEEVEQQCENFKSAIMEAATKVIPKVKRKAKQKWMTEEILNLMEERRCAKGNKETYEQIHKKVQEKCNMSKENWINEKCKEIKQQRKHAPQTMYRNVEEITGKRTFLSTGCIKAMNGGDIIIDKEKILERWAEYIRELFKDDRKDHNIMKNNFAGPPIMKEEVETAIKKMKHVKATGPDNISVELIEALEDLGIRKVTHLLNEIYDTGQIPTDLSKFENQKRVLSGTARIRFTR